MVSPMFISAIPETHTMSPADTESFSTLFRPSYVYSFAIFPFSVLSALHTATLMPLFTVPLSILPMAILPK